MIKLIVDCYLMLGKHAGMHCSISAVIRKCFQMYSKADKGSVDMIYDLKTRQTL